MPTVSLFVTCLLDALFPDAAQAVVTVLRHLGVRVHVPKGQTCCGQPAFNAGCWPEARAMARHTIDVFDGSSDPIVIASGSCGAMLAHQYPGLFGDDPVYGPKARALSARVVEFTQYVVDRLQVTDLGCALSRSVVYHPSCHALRGMGVDRQPRALLAAVKGLSVLPQAAPETCCGFGGVFSLKMAETSGAMMADRIAAFEATGAEMVVGCDIGCLMHIEGGLRKKGSPVRTMHIAQLLAEGLK
jgi:L-lactate dehydrogenase complex protein LldE